MIDLKDAFFYIPLAPKSQKVFAFEREDLRMKTKVSIVGVSSPRDLKILQLSVEKF